MKKAGIRPLIALDHGRYTMDETILVSSLQLLSQLYTDITDRKP